MGWGQSKEGDKSSSVVTQTQTVTTDFKEQLGNISFILIAMAVMFGIILACVMWHRCKKTTRNWVQKQLVTGCTDDATGSAGAGGRLCIAARCSVTYCAVPFMYLNIRC